jgi:hypothetical protein
MGAAMISIVLSTVRFGLVILDAGIARIILRFWISTLVAQRRHGRQF